MEEWKQTLSVAAFKLPCKKTLKVSGKYQIVWRIGTSVPWARVSWLASLALMHIKYDMPVDLDETVNRPPPENDAISSLLYE